MIAKKSGEQKATVRVKLGNLGHGRAGWTRMKILIDLRGSPRFGSQLAMKGNSLYKISPVMGNGLR